MPVTKIQTIVDRDGNTVLPRTRIEAITLSDGTTTLEEKLVFFEEGVPSGGLSWDALSLNGHTSDDFALVDHTHSTYALTNHTHDDRYYTESEVDTLLSSKVTQSDITSAINTLVDGAPVALDTLNELANALGDDANYAASITTALGTKAPLANPTFTGTVSGVTASMVGLGNVNNTSDINKPISSATQTALDGKVTNTNVATIGASADGSDANTYTFTTGTYNVGPNTANMPETSTWWHVFYEKREDTNAMIYATSASNSGITSWYRMKVNGTWQTWRKLLNNDVAPMKSTSTGTAVNYIWSGTQAQYDAIGSKDANTLYFVGG